MAARPSNLFCQGLLAPTPLATFLERKVDKELKIQKHSSNGYAVLRSVLCLKRDLTKI